MQRILFLIIFSLVVQNNLGQNPKRLAQADSLYAHGVDLYYKGKYEEAILMFKESISIDTKEKDSLYYKIGYSKHWIASCYFKSGNLEKAALYDDAGYDLPPIDYRLMVRSDSIANTISGDDGPNLLMHKLKEIYQLEYSALGRESRLTIGTRQNIALLTLILESQQKAKEQIRQILDDCDALYGENCRLKKYILTMAIYKIYAFGTIDDVVEGFNELFSLLERNGESESEFAIQQWRNLAEAYMRVGMMDKFDQVTEHLLPLANKFYGKTEKQYAYISLLLDFARANKKMNRTEIALQHVQSAENYAIEKYGKYSEFHLLALLEKSSTFVELNRSNEAQKILKQITRHADATTEYGRVILSCVPSFLLMIGKHDKKTTEEVNKIRQEIASTQGKENELYLGTCGSLLMGYMFTDMSKATSLADEEGALFERMESFELLFMSAVAYLAGDYYVKSRKASSVALEILNKKLSGRYAAPEVENSKTFIKNGLSIVHMKLENVSYSAHDTIRYSLSMIKQDLLQAKLLLLEHSDSLGTANFLQYLKDYAIVALKDTKDQLMADSIVNRFSKSIKEKFGEESQEFQKVSKIMDIAKFEIEYSTLAWKVQHYKNSSDLYGDSLYREAVTKYNETFELWEKGEVKQETSRYSPPETPYIATVLRERNFQEAYVQYEKAFDYELSHSGLALYEAIKMGMCADSLGEPALFKSKMEKWKKKLVENNKYTYTTIKEWSQLLAAVRLHTDNDTYEVYETEILGHVEEKNRLKLQISAMLQVIDAFYSWDEKRIYKHTLISSLYRLDNFLDALKSSSKDIEILPLFAAVSYAKCMTLYHDYSFYGYDKRNLIDDFKNIYLLLSENLELQGYKESCDIMCMLCDIAYDEKDYKLVVTADRLRRKIRNILSQKPQKGYSSGLFGNLGLSFSKKEFPEDKLEILKAEISWAYEYSKEKKTDNEIYDDLVSAWNDIRAVQRQGYFNTEDLEKKIKELSTDVVYALSAGNCSDSIKGLAYDFALFSKGYLLRSEQEFIKVLQESGNRTVLKQYEDYLRTKRQLDDTTLPLKDIAHLRNEADSILSDLRYSSKTFDDYTKSLEISWKDVQEALDEDEVAIEYINNESAYYALILKKGYDAPIVGTEYISEEYIKELGYSIYLEHTSRIWPDFVRIEGEYINPLEGTKNIYFSPTGILHQIAMENMVATWGSDTLMCEKYNLHRVSNTREIIKHKNNQKKVDSQAKKTALYGGVEYYIDDWTEIALRERHKNEESMYAMRDIPALERGATFYLEPLPGTKKEVEQIADIFNSSGLDAGLYIGTYATEDEFKRTSGSDVTMLHIATHGFYQTLDELKDSTTISFIRKGDDAENQSLSRSGLFLTGASSWFYGETIPNNVNDGILTAREISYLDLTNIDLVVLSACNTGLGEITGEGVFGLQRGFKKAGVQSILMSLWEVDDQATQILMSEFYRNLITNQQTKRQALVNAQFYLRTYEKDGKRPYDNPRYWAAFILLDGLD